MFRILKVTENSLSPFFLEGDFVVVSKVPFYLRPPKSGDIIVFNQPSYGIMIKQVEQVSPDGSELIVVGTHPFSADSRQFGPIRKEAVLGKVVWHIRKP